MQGRACPFFRMNLSSKLILGFALTLALFSAVTVVNYNFSKEVQENTIWLTRSEVVIRQSNQLQRLIIDMESGLRGFLLTDKESFLEPYLMAQTEIPDHFLALRSLVNEDSEQGELLKEIALLESDWRQHFAEPLIRAKRQGRAGPEGQESFKTLFTEQVSPGVGKKKIDRVREIFKTFNGREYTVREARRNRLNESLQETRNLSLAISAISGLLSMLGALYLTRHISTRINRMVRLAETIAQGNYKIQLPDGGPDELGRLTEALNRMAGTIDTSFTELARKNKELDQFAYVVSHDLKAPLRGIENASRWIDEDMPQSLPNNIKQYLHLMRGRVHRMENLINGILDLARVGRVKHTEEQVDVRALVLDVIDLLSPPTHISVHLPDRLPLVRTIRVELEQVFSNLISNAIKYNDKPKGNIWIRAQDLGAQYEFMVRDDGPGIEQEYHDKIFVIFQTLQERDTLESTGVGLAIVKKIVERQGGTIRVESEPGKGSSFFFTWPKRIQSAPSA